MNTQEAVEAVFQVLLDPSADPIESAHSLGLSLTAFLEIAESPQVTEAIEALERIAEIRTRALLARTAHTAIEALERIAASDPQTPGAVETCRKAAAQLLRMAPKRADDDAHWESRPRAEPARPPEHAPSEATRELAAPPGQARPESTPRHPEPREPPRAARDDPGRRYRVPKPGTDAYAPAAH